MADRFPIIPGYDGDCTTSSDARHGTVYHVNSNRHGGCVLTPVAMFFATRPTFIEGYNPYWRIDCFVRDHALAPEPEKLGNGLAAALQHNGLCSPPIWVSWHKSTELAGRPIGEVFDSD